MRAIKQGAFDLVPMPLQVAAQLRGPHAVHTGRPFVALHPFQGFEHVPPLKDRLHEAGFFCRIFVGTCRYEAIDGTAREDVCVRPSEIHQHLRCLHTAL